MFKNLELYFVVILSLLLHTAYAQESYIIDVQQFGLEEGLSHRYVNDVFKDSNGFLWIATQYSLQRYDGYEFKTFPLLKQKTKFSSFMKIGETNDGWLYVFVTETTSQHKTIVFLNPLTGESLSAAGKLGEDLSKELESLLDSKKYYIGDDNNQICFVDWNEIVLFHFEKGIEKIKLPSAVSEEVNTNYSLRLQLIDSLGNYWLRAEIPQRLMKFNPKENTLESIRATSTTKQEVNEWEGEVYIYDKETQNSPSRGNTILSKYHASGKIEKLFEIPQRLGAHKFLDGKLWCIGELGWEVFDTSGTLLFELKRKDYDIELFGEMSYKNIISDKSGKFYLNSQFGFNIIETKKSPFIQYFSKTNDNTLPFNNAARGIYVQNDSILVNFEFGGLVLLNKKESEEYKVISTLSLEGYPERGYNGKTILRDEKGHYRIGHDAMYLQSIWSSDLTREDKVNDNNISDRDNFNPSWAIWEDENNCIWSSYNYGLKRICEGDSVQDNFPYKDMGMGFLELNIYHFSEAENAMVWLSSKKGLYLFDKENKKVLEHYHEQGEGKYYLPANDIFHMHIDGNGNRWLGTRSGLIFWDTKTNEKRLFDRSDGLSNEVIYAVYEDAHNKLWLSSDYGIMSLDKETFDVQTYLPKDGTTQEEFNRISHFKAKDGTIYFGGLNGVTAFQPDDLIGMKNSYSRVLLSECIIFDGKEDRELDEMKNIVETQILTFNPNDRYFKLKFTLPTFGDIHKTLYAWKIEGVFDDWNYQKENTLQFGALPYGNHTLHIKGQSTSGGWSPHELKLQIQVVKPFYLQAWFMGLSAIAILGSIFLFFRSRTRRLIATQKLLEEQVNKATAQIKEQAEGLKQLDKAKSRFFANVSHELRTPLTLILGPIGSVIKSGELNKKNAHLIKKASRSGRELLKLVGSILDLSKMDSGKIELCEQPEFLYSLMDRMIFSFESHAQSNGITFTFDYQTDKNLQIELDKNKMEVVLNNLLSNAVKFTPVGGSITTTVRDNGNTIQIKVEDTGRGIHPKDQLHVFDRFYQSQLADAPTEGGTGIGLALTNEFVKMMGGEISLKSEFGKGSVFTVEIPKKETDILVRSVEQPDYTYAKEPIAVLVSKETLNTKKEINKDLPTILVTEDNFSLREYIVTILEPYYNVITAENGLKALDALQEYDNVDLIMSDIMMPGMDGFQLLKVLKSKDYFRQIPVIMLTARADIKDKLKALRIGVDDYLLKPFEEEELLARIENLLLHYQERKGVATEGKSEKKLANTPSISKEDSEWLETLEKHLQEHVSDNSYSVVKLAYDMALSERQLRRRIKTFTGLTPIQYFKEIRLGKARQFLEGKEYKTVAQTAYAVGFQDAGAFSRNFLQRYGKSPSSYLMN